jgi:hypothetical protein
MSSSRSLRAGRRPLQRRAPAHVAAGVAVAVLVTAASVALRTDRQYDHGDGSVAWPARSAPTVPLGQPAGEVPAATGGLPGSGVVGRTDGVLPAGVSVLDVGYPGVSRLAPSLLRALQAAARDAAADGVELDVNSGWRSRRYQEQLFRRAVGEYGSATVAARWVARPGTSVHEAGEAVDLGKDAAAWLATHGAGYGLCRTYANESWHYELRPAAVGHGCPAPYADPAHDPRVVG